jgi:hypothetical protein
MSLVIKKQEFLVDKNGKAKAVVLSLPEYSKLLEFIEDLEDALDLRHAVETCSKFISHDKLLLSLRKQKLI